ncbi:hypothetical protein LR010_01140 [Candidatus Gracilibacteria bacterium]|nr:hypothetical protein [Candidatus Gracilibacteria bacterium]
MKLTKRMKNSIVQGVIVNIFFLLVLIAALVLFLYPRVTEIESKKETLLDAYNKFQEVSVKGVSFGDFKTSIRGSELSKDAYTQNLMKNVTQEFYVSNLNNSGGQDYDTFLNELKLEVSAEKSSEEYIVKDKALSTVLPVYDEKNIFSDEGLSDFFFTNYVENILYSFNLSSKGEIGIGNLERQGNAGETEEESDSLQEDIFSIPLVFKIEGQKRDVIDFIYYFERVGGIYVEGDELSVYSDNFINKRLEGTDGQIDYNIYKNQIADIKNFSLEKYPDSSALKTEGLIDAMKGAQGREKINMEIELSFYVAGVPGYKMEEYIENFLTLYTDLSSEIALNTKKYTSQAYKYSDGNALLSIKNLQSLDSVMLSLANDVLQIRTGIASRENISALYKQVVTLKQQLSKIQVSYNKQISILTK